MLLNGVKIYGRGDDAFNIRIEAGKIAEVSENGITVKDDTLVLTFNSALAFPGLINSHDHLDFNLFQQLGDKTYNNYVEWGEYIQQNYQEQIAAVVNVPQHLRAQWGIYKNLLCGITTVVNHGEHLQIDNPLIMVFDNCQSLHSVANERNWKIRLNNPLKANTPAVIHVGEGSDTGAFAEINKLIRWTIIKRKLIGVHGVAMRPSQAGNFDALVWCPDSNYFLLNKTARIDLLKHCTNILFGTDSTLSATWNIWDHLRLAQKTGLMDNIELYQSLTTNPAKAWRLNTGQIIPGKDADIVIAKSDPDSFFSIDPADLLLVMHRGNMRLVDEELFNQMDTADLGAFSKIYIGDACKYVQGDLPGLIKQIHQYYPEAKFPVQTEQYTTTQ